MVKSVKMRGMFAVIQGSFYGWRLNGTGLYNVFFNRLRPHQGINGRIPVTFVASPPKTTTISAALRTQKTTHEVFAEILRCASD